MTPRDAIDLMMIAIFLVGFAGLLLAGLGVATLIEWLQGKWKARQEKCPIPSEGDNGTKRDCQKKGHCGCVPEDLR